MKVWVVSHAYVSSMNRAKLLVLAAIPDLELTLLAPAEWRSAFGPLAIARCGYPFRVVTEPVFLNGRIGGYLFRGGMRELRRARPDIVHAEVEPWSLVAFQSVLASRGAKIILFTWENVLRPQRMLSRAVERFVLKRVDFMIAGSQGARDRLRRLGFDPGRVAVLPQFGVDPAHYSGGDAARVNAPFAVVPPRAVPVVGYVGRLVPEKGVDLLIRALGWRSDVRLLVVGDGTARLSLERLACELLGRHRVHFTGAVPDVDVPDYLAAMDVLVLPSRTTPRWTEQFGHVLIEAMAAGVPIVGSDSGAIPEVIGEAGLIFREGDVTALQGCLRAVLDDFSVRERLAEQGRAKVWKHYTHEKVVAAQYEIYRRLCAQ